MDVIVRDLSYSLPAKKNRKKSQKGGDRSIVVEKKKEVLKNVTLHFEPGQLHFIIGATGAGKSSLLDCIMGLVAPKHVKGDVLFNGHAMSPSSSRSALLGFVEQSDSLNPDLTVEENLSFSLQCSKIFSSLTIEQRKETVSGLIRQLGLEQVADSRVGSTIRRGISGGEMKRTAIGMELIVDPGAILLDEPTTGLDSSTSYQLTLHLKDLADKGKTVISTLHQPRYSIFKQCDTLTLLAQGSVVYHGKAKNAEAYFTDSLGFQMEVHDNPPDFFMDVVAGIHTQTSNNGTQLPSGLAAAFQESFVFQDIMDGIDKAAAAAAAGGGAAAAAAETGRGRGAPFGRQAAAVARRATLQLRRSPALLALTVKSNIMLALLVGSIFYQLDVSVAGLENRAGAFFFITMNVVYMNTSTVGHFHTEKAMFVHEKMNGYYSVPAYFLAKLFAHLLPMQVIPTSLFALISYFMIGLRSGVEPVVYFVLILCLASIASASMGFFFGTLVSKPSIGNLLFSLLSTLMLVGAGFLMKMDDLGAWAKWLPHVSIFRYIMEGLSINEFSGNPLFIENPEMPTICSEAEAYLLKHGYGDEDGEDRARKIICIKMLGQIALVSLLGTYMNLRRMKRT